MKNLYFLFIVTVFFTLTYSQDSNINWGEKFKEDKGEDLGQIIYDDGKLIYATIFTYHNKSLTPGIVILDNNLKEVKRNNVNTTINNSYFLGIEYLDGNFVSLISTYNEDNNTKELYATIISQNLEVVKKDVKLWSFAGNKGESFDFLFKLSQDSSKLLIYVNPQQPKNQNERFAFALFDKDLNNIQQKTINLNFTEKEFVLLDLTVTNNADVFAFAKKYISQKEKVKDADGKYVAGYHLALYRFTKDGEEREFKVNLDDKFLVYDKNNKGYQSSIYRSHFHNFNTVGPNQAKLSNKVIQGNPYRMTSDKSGNLYFIAFYENEYEKGINGFVYYTFDSKTGDVISNYNWKVPTTLSMRLKTIENENNKSKEPAIGREFSISDFLILEDRIFVIAEKNFSGVISRSVVQGSSTGVSANYFFSNGMIAFELEKSGRVKWNTYIPKLQLNPNFTYYQYHATFVKNGKLNILYNDEPKNSDFFVNSPKPPLVFNNEKKMQLVMVSLDEKGKAVRKVIGDNEQMETNVLILKSHQTNSERFFLHGYQWNTKENRLGLATFQ